MSVNLSPSPFAIGGMQVRRIMEMQMLFRLPSEMFPSATAEELAELVPQVTPWAVDPATGQSIIAVQSYLVRTGRHTILIDTCVGCDKSPVRVPSWGHRTDRGWLERLAAAGVAPEDVDFVMCTHLHVDHSGWNTQLIDGRWVPTFPNAKYIFSRAEYEHSRAGASSIYHENVLPVVEAGQALIVESDHALDDEIWLEPIPGHTPGHVAVNLRSQGDHALMWGDLLHSPLQCARPDWWFAIDTDREQSVASRKRVLETCCEHNRLVMTAHFPSPSVGRIDRAGNAFRFRYDSRE